MNNPVEGIFGRSPSSQTVTNVTNPSSDLQPHLLNYYGGVSDWYNSNPQMVADLSPETQQAWAATANRAKTGSYAGNAAQGSLYANLMGKMLNPETNPYQQTASNGVSSRFNDIMKNFNAGRGSNIDFSGNLGSALGGLAGNIYGQEKANMAKSMVLSPVISGLDFQDINALSGVGDQRRAYNQSKLNEPVTRLNAWGSLLQPGNNLGTQSVDSPLYKNPVGGALGGAMAGGSMGGGWGALGGGILGFLTNR